VKHIILGTAGHVDHGKTALVSRITGHNTDRLKEEISRGITIELGFAPFTLPNGQRLGIVDVPGHERFIKNMLAGATGIDMFMLVIAADEGVMPQTREHIDILRLLGVDRGLIALTKIDLVDDEWLELAREDVKEYLGGGPFAGAPIVDVSSVTGAGLPRLLETISELCMQIPERSAGGIARLALDRVFTLAGFGTVVTGTLWGGAIKQGDALELFPSGKQARVRSLQVHGEKQGEAYAGQRVAVNLTGIEKTSVERGNWLATPGTLRENKRVDIRLELLDSAPEMTQRARVHVHHGTAGVLARVKLLDCDRLPPGGSCFAQLELEGSLAALPGDRVVLRFYSPVFTIGGGIVLDASASRYRRRRLDEGLLRLEVLQSGDPGRILTAFMSGDGKLWQLADVASCLQINPEEAGRLVREMEDSGELLALHDGYFLLALTMRALCEALGIWLEDYTARWPLRFGAPKSEAARALFPKMDQKQQRALFQYLDSVGGFEQDDKSIWPAGWATRLDEGQSALVASVREAYAKSPFSPPPWPEMAVGTGIPAREQGEYLQWFLHRGELVRVSEAVCFTKSALEGAEKLLRDSAPGGFALAEARDLLATSRKDAQLICDYFDSVKLTRRDGEKRFWLR